MYFTYILIQKKRNILTIFTKLDHALNFTKKSTIFFVNDYTDEEKTLINSVITNYKTKRPFWLVRFISLILDLRSFCILFFYPSPFMRSLNFIPDFLDLFLQCVVYHLSNTLTTLLMRRHFLFHAMTKVQVLLG